jgi:hypothetical protein
LEQHHSLKISNGWAAMYLQNIEMQLIQEHTYGSSEVQLVSRNTSRKGLYCFAPTNAAFINTNGNS